MMLGNNFHDDEYEKIFWSNIIRLKNIISISTKFSKRLKIYKEIQMKPFQTGIDEFISFF